MRPFSDRRTLTERKHSLALPLQLHCCLPAARRFASGVPPRWIVWRQHQCPSGGDGRLPL